MQDKSYLIVYCKTTYTSGNTTINCEKIIDFMDSNTIGYSIETFAGYIRVGLHCVGKTYRTYNNKCAEVNYIEKFIEVGQAAKVLFGK